MTAPLPTDPGGAPLTSGEYGVPRHEIERLLCRARAGGALENLMSPAPDAWTMTLPGLDSLTGPDEAGRPLRICIATEQIAGPIRNGGIGNTYASLALMLAAQGFDVTALYLRGTVVETETIEHWIAHYAEKGVKLVAVPDYAKQERLRTGADRWLHGSYNMMRYLIDHPMDVVHVSEWRGSAYLSLLAKRQGLAFADTLFVVKTSSPWMWNRLYGAHMIEKLEDLAKIPAERQSVELADIVVGGSLHLLRWMASQGYAIPRDRAFVQPNVVDFTSIKPLVRNRPPHAGARVPIDEFVFFGRLEERKGLFIFCQTIRRLIRKGVKLPPRITFMGKPGGRLPSHPDLEAPDALRIITRDWPTEVAIITHFQQFDAVEYLLGGPRLAIMPSIIENSSMAIYEAAICGIPLVASDVGGNAELIREEDHAQALCMPHPASLGQRLEEALALGGFVPRPSFDNDANLETWRRFHRRLRGPLHARLLAQSSPPVEAKLEGGVSVCIYFTGDEAALERTLLSLAAQTLFPAEVLVGVDAESSAAFGSASDLLERHGFAPRVFEAYDLDAGAAFQLLAEAASGQHLHFLWEGSTLHRIAIATLRDIAGRSGADVLAYLHRVEPSHELRGIILGSTSDQFFRDDTRELPLFVKRETFRRLGGFTADYRVAAHDHEFAAKAQLAGVRCRTAMIELGAIQGRSADWAQKQGYDLAHANFRAIRPTLVDAPLVMRDLLLFARGTTTRANYAKVRKPAPPPPRAGNGAATPTPLPPPPLSTKIEPKAAREANASGLSPALEAALASRAARTDGQAIGQLLGLYRGRLYGWAIDAQDSGRAVDLDLVVEGVASVHRAKGRFAAHVALPPEATRHGFVIDLPEDYHRNSEGLNLSLTVAGTTLLLAEGLVVPPNVPLQSCGLEGLCVPSDDGTLSGWICYSEEPERHVELAAYIDGTFLARFRADIPSSHPRSAERPGWAFRFGLPKRLHPERTQIDVVVAEAGIILPGAPLMVEGARVRPSARANRLRTFWRRRR